MHLQVKFLKKKHTFSHKCLFSSVDAFCIDFPSVICSFYYLLLLMSMRNVTEKTESLKRTTSQQNKNRKTKRINGPKQQSNETTTTECTMLIEWIYSILCKINEPCHSNIVWNVNWMHFIFQIDLRNARAQKAIFRFSLMECWFEIFKQMKLKITEIAMKNQHKYNNVNRICATVSMRKLWMPFCPSVDHLAVTIMNYMLLHKSRCGICVLPLATGNTMLSFSNEFHKIFVFCPNCNNR